jgi:hypothetical protein
VGKVFGKGKVMKIAVLRTYSLSCVPIYEPLRRFGHELREIVFFDPGIPARHSDQENEIDGFGADMVVMLGQNDDGGGHVPDVHTLDRISRKRPFVHICCDGSEKIWWPQLQHYKENAPEILHVNIDGVPVGFFESNGITTLCPIDDEPFQPRPFLSRTQRLAFCGGWGILHPRGEIVEDLINRGVLHAIKRPFADYDQYRQFMCDTRIAWNQAFTGTADHMHVKARVIEAALAGALVLDNVEAPTWNYFDPGADYLTYNDLDDIVVKAAWVDANPEVAAAMAIRMRAKVRMHYAARPFWNKIFARIGMPEEIKQ